MMTSRWLFFNCGWQLSMLSLKEVTENGFRPRRVRVLSNELTGTPKCLVGGNWKRLSWWMANGRARRDSGVYPVEDQSVNDTKRENVMWVSPCHHYSPNCLHCFSFEWKAGLKNYAHSPHFFPGPDQCVIFWNCTIFFLHPLLNFWWAFNQYEPLLKNSRLTIRGEARSKISGIRCQNEVQVNQNKGKKKKKWKRKNRTVLITHILYVFFFICLKKEKERKKRCLQERFLFLGLRSSCVFGKNAFKW